MEVVLRVRDPTFFAELVNGMNEAMKRCWIEALQGDNSNARVAALRTIIMGKAKVGSMAMEAGYIETVPQKIDESITFLGTPFDLDSQMKQILIEEAKRKRGEKTNVAPGTTNSG